MLRARKEHYNNKKRNTTYALFSWFDSHESAAFQKRKKVIKMNKQQEIYITRKRTYPLFSWFDSHESAVFEKRKKL